EGEEEGEGGGEMETDESLGPTGAPPRKRRRVEEGAGIGTWTVRTGQWRVRVQAATSDKSAVECVLIAVKIDAFTAELARNQERTFLSGAYDGELNGTKAYLNTTAYEARAPAALYFTRDTEKLDDTASRLQGGSR
ncbi:hypothetical protein V500_10499, partial [Pseudogymnoascus sp. VKM F-4518 (FW-2643)]